MLSTTLESPYCLRECVLDLCSLAMVYFCDSLLINLMMSLVLSCRSQISFSFSSFLHRIKSISPSPSQSIKRGQAGEGAAGDAGDGVGIEISAMEWFRDQSEREGERLYFIKKR